MAKIKRVTGYEVNGRFFQTEAAAQEHLGILGLDQAIETLGIGSGGNWPPKMIASALIENAGLIGPLLMQISANRPDSQDMPA